MLKSCLLVFLTVLRLHTFSEAQSCGGRCNEYVQFARCQCDSSCIYNQNCCSDFWSKCLDIRLVDGRTPNEGRVELVLGSESIGSVCDEGWSIMDATVACNQLGYPGASFRTEGHVFGSGNLPLIASHFLCDGAEGKITDCTFNKGFYCESGGGAGVICQKPGYQGCFGRPSSSLLLRDSHYSDFMMTADLCIQHCGRGKFELAAVRGTDCTCGLGIPIDSDYYHDYRCRMPCPGDNLQACGGYTEGRLMVYKTDMGFCRHPGNPANGQRLDDYFRFGERVRFSCNPGYRMGGNATIQCLPRDQTDRPIKNLAWSGIAPVCIGNQTSIQLPGPSKRRSSMRNVIIGVVVSFLVVIILLILLVIWRLKRKMSKEAPRPPAPLPPKNASPPMSGNTVPRKPEVRPVSNSPPVSTTEGTRPVYAKLTPRADKGSTASNTSENATSENNLGEKNTNVNKCIPNSHSNPGYNYILANDEHLMSSVFDSNSGGTGKVFYSTKIRKKSEC